MDWFQPTTSAITQLSEVCMELVLLVYLLRFRHKTRDTYLIIIGAAAACLSLVFAFLYDANINATPYALFEEIANISTRCLFLFVFLLTAYLFDINPFPREALVASVLFLLLSGCSAFLWFRDYAPNQPPSAVSVLVALSLYIFTTLMSTIVLLRKIKLVSVQMSSPAALISQLLNPSSRQVRVYRGFAFVGFLYTLFWICFLLTLVQVISWAAWNYIAYLLVFFLITFYILTYYNYAPEATSFQAKLVGTVLFIVLGILGAMPMILFGDTRFIPASPSEQQKINAFLIIIPLTTIIIAVVLPFVFRRVILKQLSEIVSAVKSVNNGNLSASVNVETNDEMGTLSQNFNQMTTSLQRYANKMNDLVEERTEALNQSLQELKSTQAQLIQSEKMASLGELTAGIAHEIQNPLNFVTNFSEVNKDLLMEIRDEVAKNNKEEAMLLIDDAIDNEEKIAFHGKRADAIVKGMLQHSRKNSGQKELTDINALCDEYLRLSYHGLRAKDKNFNADFNTDFDESIGKINVVPQDIGRVLLNLFNNAFYAVNEKKKGKEETYKPLVSVQTKKTNRTVEIMVRDNGNGIPHHIIDKVFQPFFTTKPTGEGTGLGLSLSYDIIIKEHSGTIKAESKEGSETAFIIQLPIT